MEEFKHKKDRWTKADEEKKQRKLESDENFTYTITEVSELLKVTRQTVWNWVKARKMNSFKFGSSIKSPVRIKKTDLDDYIERSKRNRNICKHCLM